MQYVLFKLSVMGTVVSHTGSNDEGCSSRVGWEKGEMPPVCLETDLLKSKVQQVLMSLKQKQAEKRNKYVVIWNKLRNSVRCLGGFLFCSLNRNSKEK